MSPAEPVEVRRVDAATLVPAASALLGQGRRLALLAGHDDGEAGLRVVYAFAGSGQPVIELHLRTGRQTPSVPTLAALSYPASRFERELQDTFGIVPLGHPQPHRLLLHGHWPSQWYPLRCDADADPVFAADVGSFPFLEVEGQGVYEIPVGPVHAGLIEPGHFRFSVVGETILRMKARLWFLHRGVERLFQGRLPQEGIALAERISGDTAVGHALAFAMAVEAAAGIDVAESDRLVRALLLELERLHNHVADLGALANDVGFGIAQSHALRLRERLLRLAAETTGHRLLRGGIEIGGARILALPDQSMLRATAADVAELVDVTLSHAVVRERFAGTAVLPPEQAEAIGTLGYVARASGLPTDARRDQPFVDLGASFAVVVEHGGDVLARYLVRAREAAVSAAVAVDLIARLKGRSSQGTGSASPPRTPAGSGAGLGLVEAWRGALCHRVELDARGVLSRVKVVDPSFFNWPALPMSLADTIVPDFPLANKSFNPSYAGNDL
jgi:Ni,Fe-hydrogenase III large subunit/Ni,Fe-hydrogenase III component G